jgi:hypothetical protein
MSQSQSQPLSQAQQAVIDFLDYRPPGWQPGGIDELEKWWVDRQVALERAGCMLRSRYRPGWIPSWAGTKTFYLDCEDGQSVGVSVTFLPSSTRAYDILATSRHGRNSHLRWETSHVETAPRERGSLRA